MNYFRVKLEDGQKIFLDGDRAGIAYLIDEGNIRLHKEHGGKDIEIDVIGPGKIFDHVLSGIPAL